MPTPEGADDPSSLLHCSRLEAFGDPETNQLGLGPESGDQSSGARAPPFWGSWGNGSVL
jgi:hypothetical protein